MQERTRNMYLDPQDVKFCIQEMNTVDINARRNSNNIDNSKLFMATNALNTHDGTKKSEFD